MLRDKRFITVTGVICILPMIAGIVLWGRLPEFMATGFTWSGTPTAYHAKWFAVFIIPLMITAIHGLCAFSLLKRSDYGNFRAFFYGWAIIVCPILSVSAGISLYAFALGFDISLTGIVSVIVALITLVYGVITVSNNKK